jgi:hypothetical protein
MEKAKREIQEREQRKAVTHGAGGPPAAPRMNIKVCHSSDIYVSSNKYVWGREQNWEQEHARGINSPRYSTRRTRTVTHWRTKSLKVGGTGKKLGTNMARISFDSSLIVLTYLHQGF